MTRAKQHEQIKVGRKYGPRMKLLTLCVGAALVQMASFPALADSGVGVDTVSGNAMNPGYPGGVVQHDAAVPYVKRTPSGQMYNYPPDRGEPSEDGSLSGSAEVGYIYADDKAAYAKRKEYVDQQNNGVYLNNFNLSGETSGETYFSVNGGGVGQKDQFYDVTVGQYGVWKVKAFYNETPHVFTTTFRPLYIDNGTGTPTLNNGQAGLAPATSVCNSADGTPQAANTACTINTYLNTLPLTEVALLRKKGGARADITLSDTWKAYGSFTRENRDGARPWGLQDSNTEGIEPIHYTTDDFLGGLQYNDGLTAANLSVSASFFRNAIDTLFAKRAATATNDAPTTLALQDFTAYSLAPDNQAYNAKAEVSRKLPDFFDGRLTASAAFGSSRQNDAIRMPLNPAASASMLQAAGQATTSGATGAVVFDKDNWNGVNGSPLSRATSGLQIDTELLNLALNLKPMQDLNVKGSYRHYATKNKSGTYYAYNPLTGQWGSGIEQTTATNFMVGENCNPAPGFTVSPLCTPGAVTLNFGGNPRSVASSPRDYKQDNFVLAADYDTGMGTVEGALEREDFSHTYRERDKTTEDKIKLGYVNTSFDSATFRTSFETDRKRGSFYDYLGAGRLYTPFVINGLTYSRATLLDMIANPGAANAAIAGGVNPTAAQLYTYITNGNNNDPRMQKTDQADRDQQIINARLNYLATDALDLGAMVQVKKVNYPANSVAGVQKDDQNTYNIEANYQASSDVQFSAYYTRQDGSSRTVENYGFGGLGGVTLLQHLTNQCGLAVAEVTSANVGCVMSNLRNPDADVTMETSNTNDVLGLGYQQNFGKFILSVDYVYAESKSAITHVYGTTALTAANQLVVDQYGAYPDMTTAQNSLAVNLLMPISKKLSARMMLSYEDFKVKDWHYDYIQDANAVGLALNDLGPQNYKVNTVSIFLNYEM